MIELGFIPAFMSSPIAHLAQLPKGKNVGWFQSSDIFKVKEVLIELLSYFAMGEDTLRKMLAGSEMVMTDDSPAHLFFPFSATFKDQYSQWPLANYKKIKAFEESVVPFLDNISDSPTKRKQVENAIRYYEYRSGS